MKRIIYVAILVSLCQVTAFSQKKYEMVIEKTDGTETVVPTVDVVRISFREHMEDYQSYTTCPDANHPHMIDLGLPSGTKWACSNVGASAPEDYGSYYTFDEAQDYNPPSFEQIIELINNCSYAWTTQNGVNGSKFTGPNGGTIFFPAAGYRRDGEFNGVGSWGIYWSSTLDEGEPSEAWYLYFNSGAAYRANDSREFGQSVRPVRSN